VRLGGRKPRALLARLALDANRTVPAERLIGRDRVERACAPTRAPGHRRLARRDAARAEELVDAPDDAMAARAALSPRARR
jgi:hypothetical protein